jgi:hypothetical protein
MIPNWRTAPVVLGQRILVLVARGTLRYTVNHSAILAEKGGLINIPRPELFEPVDFFVTDGTSADQLYPLLKRAKIRFPFE